MNSTEYRVIINRAINDVAPFLSAAEMVSPLIGAIASVLALNAQQTGTSLSELTDIAAHELDVQVIKYKRFYEKPDCKTA